MGGDQVPWPSSLARGPYGWAQIATFVVTGALVVVFAVSLREALPGGRASKLAVALLGLLGVALILAAFPVDVPMLTGGQPETWHGWLHAIAFLLIIAMGVLAPMALAARGDFGPATDGAGLPGDRCAVRGLLAAALGQCHIPNGLMAIVTLFGWIAVVAARLRAPLAER